MAWDDHIFYYEDKLGRFMETYRCSECLFTFIRILEDIHDVFMKPIIRLMIRARFDMYKRLIQGHMTSKYL